jgi:hypothetical protein
LAPSAAQVGDVMVMFVWQPGTVSTITIPTGWTQDIAYPLSGSSLVVAHRVKQAGDPSSWTVTGIEHTATNQVTYGMWAYSGASDSFYGVYAQGGTDTSLETYSVNTLADMAVVTWLSAEDGDNPAARINLPSELTPRLNNITYVAFGDAEVYVPGGTTVGPYTATRSGAWSAPWAYFMILMDGIHPPPMNDNWANATDLGRAVSGSFSGTTKGATSEDVEDTIFTDASVWYGWTAPDRGVLTLTPEPNYGQLDVWIGSPLAQTWNVFDTADVAVGDGSYRLAVSVFAGVHYWIRVSDSADFTVNWTFEDFPVGCVPAEEWIAAGFVRRYMTDDQYADLYRGLKVAPDFATALITTDHATFSPLTLPITGDWTSTNFIVSDGPCAAIGGWIFPGENHGLASAGLVITNDAGRTWKYPSSVFLHDHDQHPDPTDPNDHDVFIDYDKWTDQGAVGNGRMVVIGYVTHPDSVLDETGASAAFFGDSAPRVISAPSDDLSTWGTASISYLTATPLTHHYDSIYPGGDEFPFGLQPHFVMLAFAGGYFFVVAEPDLIGGLYGEDPPGYTAPDELAHMWRSLDGITWIETGRLPETNSALRAIASDGTKWIGSGFWYDNPPYGGSYSFNRSGPSHGHPFGGTRHKAMWRSLDAGNTWVIVADDLSEHLNPIVCDHGVWLAAGSTGLHRSDDGETWTLVRTLYNISDIYWDGDRWWVSRGGVDAVATVWTGSSDGLTWTPITTNFDDGQAFGSFFSRGYCIGVRKVVPVYVPPNRTPRADIPVQQVELHLPSGRGSPRTRVKVGSDSIIQMTSRDPQPPTSGSPT